MNFIKLHRFEEIGKSAIGINYLGEIIISINEITYVEPANHYLKDSGIKEDFEKLAEINKDRKMSIVHTKIGELTEVLVLETVRDIHDYIR